MGAAVKTIYLLSVIFFNPSSTMLENIVGYENVIKQSIIALACMQA